MLVSFATAAVAAAQPQMMSQASPLPPIVTVVPAPPPQVVRAMRATGDLVPDTPVPVIAVRVRVTAAGQQLLNDTFRLSRNASASYQESRSEAPDIMCSTQRSYGSQQRYSLNVNLYLREDGTNGPAVNVSVRWQRPVKLMTCGGEGSREVQLTQTIPLAPGQSMTVEGDAGLAVTISR